MLKEFNAYIKKQKLFSKTEKVLLAVSGGIDSVVMCELFHKSGQPFAIAHCNFQLRGNESDEDESFTEALAEKYGVRHHSVSFDTSAFAKKKKLSIQAAARELRYSWLGEIREQFGYDLIATAHHRDDSIETFLINLVRGTGISGLHGILPKRDMIVRPMLLFTKAQITAYAKKEKLAHREDSSNTSDKYLRNRIRRKLIPLLEELNPSIRETISTEIGRLAETEKIYREAIEKKKNELLKKNGNGYRISLKHAHAAGTSVMFEILRPFGFNAAIAEDILRPSDRTSGKTFFSATHRLISDRKDLIIEALSAKKEKSYFLEKGQTEIELDGKLLRFRNEKPGIPIRKKGSFAYLDSDKLEFPLEIRHWNKADIFQPFGMKGKKKLSDFFIDQKLSLDQKENVWLLCSGGKIVWVAGMRIDERFRVSDKTKKIFVAELV